MVKFTHYLVTRFNVTINGNGPEFIRSDARSPDWLTERTALFEAFCAPTVRGQINQNFSWLIYCDHLTPKEIIQRIQTATSGIRSSQIIHVAHFDKLLIHLKQMISQCETSYVITTRLDNDDGIGIHFIDDIQNHFVEEDMLIINQLGGVHYHVVEKILTFHKHYPHNSFTSLIEARKTDPVTIMGFNHLNPHENMRTLNVQTKYAFWRTLHRENTALRGNRGWPILSNKLSAHYSLPFSKIPISIPHMLRYFLLWFPRALQKKVIFLVRKGFYKMRTQ